MADLLESRVEPSDDVVFRTLDEESVLLHMGSSKYFGLDEVGTRIWQWIESDGDVGTILARLLHEYHVDQSQARNDLEELLQELIGNELIRIVAPGD